MNIYLPYGKVRYISIDSQNSRRFRLSFLVLIITQFRVVFFDEHNDDNIKKQNQRQRLSKALDDLNGKYGNNTVTIGLNDYFVQ